MKEFTLQTELWLPRPRDEVFPFFAEARNLEALTPPWLKFEVRTPTPIVMRPGTLIDYRITVHGLPIRWRTKIAEWEPPRQFVDLQLCGPYTLWHHTHTFEERDGGTHCLDHVRYRPRGGALIHWLFVRRDVERIFQYRQQRLKELFGSRPSEPSRAIFKNPQMAAELGAGELNKDCKVAAKMGELARNRSGLSHVRAWHKAGRAVKASLNQWGSR